jgi:hypothetical protein
VGSFRALGESPDSFFREIPKKQGWLEVVFSLEDAPNTNVVQAEYQLHLKLPNVLPPLQLRWYVQR